MPSTASNACSSAVKIGETRTAIAFGDAYFLLLECIGQDLQDHSLVERVGRAAVVNGQRGQRESAG